MKKHLITLLAAIVLLGGLLGIYFVMQNKPEEEEPEPLATNELNYILERDRSEVTEITVENEKGTITFTPCEKNEDNASQNWEIPKYKDLKLLNSTVDSMLSPAYYLTAAETLVEQTDNPAEYGLDKPLAKATTGYTDGSESILRVGSFTPAGDYYYACVEGDPAVYLIYSTTGRRLMNSYNEIIDKSFTGIDYSIMTYFYGYERDVQEVEVSFDGKESEKKKSLEKYGGIPLTLKKPFEGADFYDANFQTNVLEKFTATSFNELEELHCDDLKKYGLDDPELIIIFEDIDNRLELYVGDSDGEGNVYVTSADSPHVFKMSSSEFDGFRAMDVFKFTSRFVALINIDRVDEIKIESSERSHEIIMNREYSTNDEGEEENEIYPTIDGKEVVAKSFRSTLYQSIIGLSHDAEIEDFNDSGKKEAIKITYVLNDGDDVVCRYYDYNDNFYAVKKDDDPARFAVNKMSMRLMFNSLDGLLSE